MNPRFLTHTACLALALVAALLPVACGGGGASTSGSAALPVSPQGKLATALGKPQRLLVGLGSTDVATIQAQKLTPDIYDRYINGVGPTSWPYWNSPVGEYVQVVARDADAVGATPMYTLYQMATLGDGDLSGLEDPDFMRLYWDNVRILFSQLRVYGKPALVNVEPDFWGYAQRLNKDPSKLFVHVNRVNADCTDQGDNLTGMVGCLVKMARGYAPKAYIGFPPSQFGDIAATEFAFFQRMGAAKADFVSMQTLDRDVGCYEAAYAGASARCDRAVFKYWDETNATSPNFKEHFAVARKFRDTLGLPLIWWQTPLGVPSASAGGKLNAFRDNRERYFLTHASELVAAGGLGVVFSPGHQTQTNVNTDGGQFKALSTGYFASPAALP